MDIDFVVTWVDGSDPAWLAQRTEYAQTGGDQTEVRFRDWGLMRYWFRAVERYASWVRKIHFVTWGHTPEWLDLTNPKLHIVRHSDFIPPEFLPTFNSHTIELNLHRIYGLTEHFVYFNDDVILTKLTAPEFFFRDGLPRDCFALDAIYFASNSIGWIAGSNISIINNHFKMRETIKKHWRKCLSPLNGVRKVIKTLLFARLCQWFPGLYHGHTAFVFLRSTFEAVWQAEEKMLRETCQSRFREKTNVSPVVFKEWQLACGQFYPAPAHESHCYHLTDRRVGQMCESIRQEKYHVICINDTDRLSSPEESYQKVGEILNEKLGQLSSFEKTYF